MAIDSCEFDVDTIDGGGAPGVLPPVVSPAWIRSHLIGRDACVQTPFGLRRIVYADHVASGRALRWIEDFIVTQVLPLYANTHTDDSATGARMTALAHDAARVIKASLGAPDAALLFCGTGCTAAIRRWQQILGLVVPEGLRRQVIESMAPAQRPIVFVGPYEHHSNEVSWRETLAEVVTLPLDSEGAIDLHALERALRDARETHEGGRPLIGSFSAASNVTGALTDTRRIARLLHEHGALACFDFAAAAPHLPIDMRIGRADGYDAVFIGAHKLLGGPGAPGLLAFDPALYKLRAPSTPGGGTVSWVSAHDHHYLDDVDQREDAGTPGTLQRIRAALAFLVKDAIGTAAIEACEHRMIRAAIARLRRHPRLELLGNLAAPRLAILSFLVRLSDGTHLHPRLVARLLNDLFGIQSRAGCACAGPYAHRLLGIDARQSDALRDAVLDGWQIVKPGWTRLNFSHFIDNDEFEFMLEAIEFIADHGEYFVDEYCCDWRSGAWHHPRDVPQPTLRALATQASAAPPRGALTPSFQACMQQARALLPMLRGRSAGCAERVVHANGGVQAHRAVPPGLPASLVSFRH